MHVVEVEFGGIGVLEHRSALFVEFFGGEVSNGGRSDGGIEGCFCYYGVGVFV